MIFSGASVEISVDWNFPLRLRAKSPLDIRVVRRRDLRHSGHCPCWQRVAVSQTDQSSTATHQLRRGESGRGFNPDYVALCAHLGLEPRTIGGAYPNQNGDVEAAQGVLKRRLKNQLLLRRSREFASVAAYVAFVAAVRRPTPCAPPNLPRSTRSCGRLCRRRPSPRARR